MFQDPPTLKMPNLQSVPSQIVTSTTITSTTLSSKPEHSTSQGLPANTSILKPNGDLSPTRAVDSPTMVESEPMMSPTHPAPPPPERGSSFAVMSMRGARGEAVTKRVSFNDTSAASASSEQTQAGRQEPPSTLLLEETVREDPNVSTTLMIVTVKWRISSREVKDTVCLMYWTGFINKYLLSMIQA